MIYKSIIITSLLLSLGFSIQVPEVKKAVIDNFSLSKVLKLSIKNDPWLLGNEYSQKSLELKSTSVSTYADPKITLSAANLPSDTFSLNQEAMTQVKVGVSQVFPRGNTLEIKKEQLLLQASQFPHQREDRKAKVTVNVAKLWFDIYQTQESIAMIEKDRFLFEQLIDISESSYASSFGRTRQQDVIRAQLELTRLDDKLTSLKQKKETLILSLSKWLYTFSNENKLDAINLSLNDIVLPKDLPSIKLFNMKNFRNKNNEALSNKFKEHPSIKSIDQKIKASAKNISLAKQKYKPQFAANASYALRADDNMGNSRTNLFSAGISFDIPIFTSKKQDKDLEASILRTRVVKIEKILQLRRLASSFETLKIKLKRLEQREELYKNELLPQMSEQAEASLSAYTNDDGAFTEVVRSLISQLNAKIDALKIKVEIQKNIIQLNYLTIEKSTQILNITN